MREMVARTMSDRMAWFWMVFEPIAIITIMIAVRTVILGHHRHISGADFVPWMVVGMMGFFLFRENMMRSIGAVNASKGLFAYRQIKPIDPVLIRCFVEGIVRTFVFLIFISVGSLLKFDLLPDSPLEATFDWLSIWALGWGVGLTLSVIATLVEEVGRVVRLISLPLLIVSGVILPLNYLPHQLQEIVLLNPIVHGIESMRVSFFARYHTLGGVDMTYLWMWSAGLLVLGMIMHLRFSYRLKAK
ncbi:ABC transporter permease [Salinicola tamaricis]|uniref:ABC transporter permease n=1 Tax=Salinicola tamaricis TaxID=1771309 RepID=UPI0030F38098